MKMICLLLGGLCLAGTLTSCDKKNNSPHNSLTQSYWMVNEDTIAYRNITVLTAPLLSELRVVSPSSPQRSEITFAFQEANLPRYGRYKVDYLAATPTACNVYVTYKGDRYDVSEVQNNTHLEISTLRDGRGRYQLQPTWFYKHLLPGDSILVKAVIIAP